MACTPNLGGSMGSSQLDIGPSKHLLFTLPSPGKLSTSMAQLDTQGFTYGISLPDYYDTFMKKAHTQDPEQTLVDTNYPSPPPTNSQPKRSVPLPSLVSSGEPFYCSLPFGSSFDSPMVTKYEAPRYPMLISPPSTIPTPTQALPLIDDILPSISEHSDFDPPCFALSPSPHSPDNPKPHQLLSPLSPEWETSGIVSEMPLPHSVDDCVLLHGNHVSSPGTFDYEPGLCRQGPSPSSRPVLSLKVPDSPYDSENLWDGQLSPMDSEYEYPSSLPTPFSPPHALPEKYSFDPTMVFGEHYSDSKYPLFPIPGFTSIHVLPELDEVPNSPSSPSLRSFSSLPELDMDENELDISPPPSLGQSLLSLPGADIDDDLLPADLAPASFIPPGADPIPATPLSNRSLLLLDDPNDIPPPRSPSPENFDLDPALLENCTNPEFQRLYDLRKKAQAAERAARQLEARMLDDGSVHMRWEARRTRKREKQRSREISAMLRLKLTERGVLDELEPASQPPVKSSPIKSMEHLVATMLLRRTETYRSLAHRKTPLNGKYLHPPSPLSRSSISDIDSTDGFDMDETEDLWPPVPWPMDLDQTEYIAS